MAERLDGADLEAEMAELGLVGEDVIFSVGGGVRLDGRGRKKGGSEGNVQVCYLLFEV